MESTLLSRAINAGAVDAACRQIDPDSVAAATALRKQYTADVAACALEQASLRRRARVKFGDEADEMYFTATGLEQATRPSVARYRAQWLRDRGVAQIADLGCGIGADARAYARAGLDVVAVEADPTTATVAAVNLAGLADVVVTDAVAWASRHLDQPRLAYLDPARRTTRGRSWDVADLTPPWDFVCDLLARGACVKLGPGFPRTLIPDGVDARWLSHSRQAVELCLSTGTGADAGARRAVIVADQAWEFEIVDAPPLHAGRTPDVHQVISEPDPAILAAGGADALAQALGAVRIAAGIGYLLHETPAMGDAARFATSYRIDEVLPYHRKRLKSWLRQRQVGRLDIKKRGIDVDPAVVRRELLGKGYGDQAATWIVTPTADGARVCVVSAMTGTLPSRA